MHNMLLWLRILYSALRYFRGENLIFNCSCHTKKWGWGDRTQETFGDGGRMHYLNWVMGSRAQSSGQTNQILYIKSVSFDYQL